MTDIAQKIDNLMAKEEELLAKAVAQTMQAYNQKPIIANLRDWEGAKQALENYRAKKAAAANPKDARFKNLLVVLEYLQNNGWKISRGKLYEDERLIKKQSDGAILVADVDKYAAQFLRKLDGSDEPSDNDKNKEETRLTKAKADKEELLFKVLQKRYVDIAQVERTRTAQTAKLLLTYENLVYGKTEKLIELVSGDMTKKHDLQAFLLGDNWFISALREFAKKDRFTFSLPTKKMLEAEELFEDANAD